MSRGWQGNISAPEDINILLLGPTGVGKTTFINAFANYLVYNSLDAAIDGELQSIIPSWFVFMDKNTFEEKTIVIGTPDQSEQKGPVGESCTKECRSFVFKINNRNLRLIDAPGIGDTRGVLQDEKNFEDILAYIAQFEYLNGICILLKPSEQRLTILFRFCIKELLRHLHVHARENIMFVFTNARATSFQPGPSAPVLRELLRTMKDKSDTEIVPFSRDNSFLLDNEAFRFLALCKNGVQFDSAEKQDYARSWDYTIKEFSRLISRIIKCDKHATRDTLSLNEAQQLIRKLSRPIGEIATLIEENLQLAQQHKNNVLSNRAPTPLIVPQKDAQIVPLGYPRTVCTNQKCTKVITIDGEKKVDYTSHCHPHCNLTGVEQEVIGDEKLIDCAAIDKTSRKLNEEAFNLYKICIRISFRDLYKMWLRLERTYAYYI
jgi:GTPase SAR1 family protein